MQDEKVDAQAIPPTGSFYSQGGLHNLSPIEKGEDKELAGVLGENTPAMPSSHTAFHIGSLQNIHQEETLGKTQRAGTLPEVSNKVTIFPNRNNNKQKSSRGSLKTVSRKDRYFGKFVLLILITSCIVILFSSIISKTRQDRVHMLEVKKRLEKQAKHLEAENAGLEREYSALREDPVRIEKEARELLGYMKPDEIFYKKYNFRIKNIAKNESVTEEPRSRWKAFLFDGPFPWQFPALIILISAAYYLITYHYEYRKLHRSNR
jgi:cell division protein FtsB